MIDRPVVVRLALEGIPVAAIARALRQPSAEIWPVLRDARDAGEITTLPKPDWPAGPAVAATSLSPAEGEKLRVSIQRALGMTPQQARFTAALITGRRVSIAQLRRVIAPNADARIVKVVACHVRARLRALGLQFETVKLFGYAMSQTQAEEILAYLSERDAEDLS